MMFETYRKHKELKSVHFVVLHYKIDVHIINMWECENLVVHSEILFLHITFIEEQTLA
jgi:hypothetical protein